MMGRKRWAEFNNKPLKKNNEIGTGAGCGWMAGL